MTLQGAVTEKVVNPKIVNPERYLERRKMEPATALKAAFN